MRQSLHLFCSTTQGFNPVSHYKKQTRSLIQLNSVGQEQEFSQSQKNTYKDNIRHGLFQQHFFFTS